MIKKIIIFVISTSLVACSTVNKKSGERALASSGTKGEGNYGNGGGACVCRDSAKKISSAYLIDLMELLAVKGDYLNWKNENNNKYYNESINVSEQIKFNTRTTNEKYKHLDQKINFVKSKVVFTKNKLQLTPTGDATFFACEKVLQDSSCKYEQLANYTDEGVLYIDGDILNKLDKTNEYAFWMHEALYKLDRELTNTKLSDGAKFIVKYMFENTLRIIDIDMLLNSIKHKVLFSYIKDDQNKSAFDNYLNSHPNIDLNIIDEDGDSLFLVALEHTDLNTAKKIIENKTKISFLNGRELNKKLFEQLNATPEIVEMLVNNGYKFPSQFVRAAFLQAYKASNGGDELKNYLEKLGYSVPLKEIVINGSLNSTAVVRLIRAEPSLIPDIAYSYDIVEAIKNTIDLEIIPIVLNFYIDTGNIDVFNKVFAKINSSMFSSGFYPLPMKQYKSIIKDYASARIDFLNAENSRSLCEKNVFSEAEAKFILEKFKNEIGLQCGVFHK